MRHLCLVGGDGVHTHPLNRDPHRSAHGALNPLYSVYRIVAVVTLISAG
jgi:hypothetical protein